ncbi:carboxypeptidase-like regulatory domain-containing protein [Archangium sp.]|uniref:carboxypeptidase-like regulatory domain-containing protein n=1 Tax=Archangium sp. TaxID=1872627 RepID=UPI00286B70B4|nr:carboxypeptidase-like regulatory domain-containing protein [Archangium sp.]
MTLEKSLSALLLAVTLAACGACTSPGEPPPTTPGTPGTSSAYTMRGTVVNVAGQPVPGAEVWADNTLHYNMNVLGTTDAQGRYSLTLPRDSLGTWRAGGKLRKQYHGQSYDMNLEVNDESAFQADAGAVRNFILKISGERPGGGYYGGVIWPDGNYSNGNFTMGQVELTLTPDGPLLDGSAGEVLKRTLDGNSVGNVPLGKYTVSARYVPAGGTPREMLVSPRDVTNWGQTVSIIFQKSPEYGFLADFAIKLAP